MLELIDKQGLVFRVKNTEFRFVKPYYLLIGWEFKKATVTGSTMIWFKRALTENELLTLCEKILLTLKK